MHFKHAFHDWWPEHLRRWLRAVLGTREREVHPPLHSVRVLDEQREQLQRAEHDLGVGERGGWNDLPPGSRDKARGRRVEEVRESFLCWPRTPLRATLYVAHA